ncbi:MAG: dTDP-4-dehydrorhamnose reductase [Oscillospiraceae bacterium]
MFYLKVLVTGVGGQLGFDIINELRSKGIEFVGTDVGDLDITSEVMVTDFVKKMSPSVVIHCAAYTAVDNAQDEKERCELVNAIASENFAKACESVNAKLVYISTDYVFDGSGKKPFEVDATPNPINVYGQTKLDGENAVQKYCSRTFVVRTSWVFGKNGTNFVKTMIKLSNERDKITVVDDQIGSPTYTKDLTALICDMINTSKYGIYHATNEGFCSFAEFATEIVKLNKSKARVIGIKSEEYKSKAQRPKNSRLSKKSLDEAGFSRLPPWQDALSRFFVEIKDEELIKQ